MKTIFEASSELFVKKRNTKAVAISVLFFAIGIALIIAAGLMGIDKASAGYMTMITVGIVAIILPLLRLKQMYHMVYCPTGSALIEKSLFFRPEDFPAVEQAITSDDAKSLSSLCIEESSGLRLDAVFTKDDQFAACQLFRYVPHNYVPATEVHHSSSNSHTRSLCEFLKQA